MAYNHSPWLGLRIEYASALYHVTARGDWQEAINLSEKDREDFISILQHVCERFNWLLHAYCLMDNHYHLWIETPELLWKRFWMWSMSSSRMVSVRDELHVYLIRVAVCWAFLSLQ